METITFAATPDQKEKIMQAALAHSATLVLDKPHKKEDGGYTFIQAVFDHPDSGKEGEQFEGFMTQLKPFTVQQLTKVIAIRYSGAMYLVQLETGQILFDEWQYRSIEEISSKVRITIGMRIQFGQIHRNHEIYGSCREGILSA